MNFFIYFNSISNSSIKISIISLMALIFGSFISLVTYRFNKNSLSSTKEMKKALAKIIFDRSKCTSCQSVLSSLNLIPLFSWLWQKGKCNKCGSNISLRYPVIELSFLILFLAIFFVFKQSLDWRMVIYFLIAATLITMCIFDIEQYFIPNFTQYILTILASILVIMEHGNAYAAIANIKAAFLYMSFGILLYCFFSFVASIQAIGSDDLKFFFVAGLMLGLDIFLPFMMLSGLLGILFGSLWQKIKDDNTFPFAPAICLSAFLCLFISKDLDFISWFGSALFSAHSF